MFAGARPPSQSQEASSSEDFNVPVSHEAGKLRIAVACQQLDAVGSHGGGLDGEEYAGRLGIVMSSPNAPNFFTKSGHGPGGERWRRQKEQPSHGRGRRR